MKKSLSDRLTRYLETAYPSWVSSGALQRLTEEKAGQTGRTAVRRLQELAEEGILEVQYREKNHAWYRAKKAYKRVEYIPVVIDGVRMVRPVEVSTSAH